MYHTESRAPYANQKTKIKLADGPTTEKITNGAGVVTLKKVKLPELDAPKDKPPDVLEELHDQAALSQTGGMYPVGSNGLWHGDALLHAVHASGPRVDGGRRSGCPMA